MRINELLDKYFEGETSATEEKELRAFFSSGKIPPHLSVYAPLFAYIDEESKALNKKNPGLFRQKRKTILYLLSGVAAVVLLILGIRGFGPLNNTIHCAENYVVINGRCYTDIHKVRGMALEALKEVATSAEEYFPDGTEVSPEKEVVEMQLKELSTLFNEE